MRLFLVRLNSACSHSKNDRYCRWRHARTHTGHDKLPLRANGDEAAAYRYDDTTAADDDEGADAGANCRADERANARADRRADSGADT